MMEKYQKGSLGVCAGNMLVRYERLTMMGCVGMPMRPYSTGRLSVAVSKLPERSALSVLPACGGSAALRAAGAYGGRQMTNDEVLLFVRAAYRFVFSKQPYKYENGRSGWQMSLLLPCFCLSADSV